MGKADALLARAATGDRDAAVACVERFGPRLAGLVARFGFEGPEAERALRAIFRRLAERAAGAHLAPAEEEVFAVQVARRWLLDRRARAHIDGRAGPAGGPGLPPAGAGQADLFGESARVVRALSALDEPARAALEGTVLGGLPYARLAELRGEPVSAVRAAARRGLVRVGELLHEPPPRRGRR